MARRLIGDSKSGLIQLTGEVGSWRTRHLRIRSAKLRELIQNGVDGWHAVHREGKELAADGMTKPLAGQAFCKFREMLFMKDCSKKEIEEVGENTTHQERPSSGLTMKAVGCGLVGAGAALLTSGNRKLAMALVASGVALCWKGGKRPASKAIEQRPHKNPTKLGGKGQVGSENGGAAHQKDDGRAGTTEEVSNPRKDHEDAVVRRSPGLRAIRSQGRRASHGSSSQSQGDAATSSTAAISTARIGQDAARPFPAGSLFGDPTGLMEQLNPKRSSQKEKEDNKDQVETRIQDLEKRLDALQLDKEKVKRSDQVASEDLVWDGMQRALVPPCRPYRALDGTVEPPGARSAPPTTSQKSSTTRTEGGTHESVWGIGQYQYCPKGQNKWDLAKMEVGWLIRCHGSEGSIPCIDHFRLMQMN